MKTGDRLRIRREYLRSQIPFLLDPRGELVGVVISTFTHAILTQYTHIKFYVRGRIYGASILTIDYSKYVCR